MVFLIFKASSLELDQYLICNTSIHKVLDHYWKVFRSLIVINLEGYFWHWLFKTYLCTKFIKSLNKLSANIKNLLEKIISLKIIFMFSFKKQK